MLILSEGLYISQYQCKFFICILRRRRGNVAKLFLQELLLKFFSTLLFLRARQSPESEIKIRPY